MGVRPVSLQRGLLMREMRLTAQVIDGAPKFLNPENLYTLLLRGLQIQNLENLGITNDKFAVVDLTGNDLVTVDNIPRLANARALLLGNNKIVHIEDVEDNLPNVTSILLMANDIAGLQSILSLSSMTLLENLVLVDNPLTRIPYYRLFAIWAIPSLRCLDFEQVKSRERQAASKLFGTREEPTPLVDELVHNKNAAHEPVAVGSGAELTAEQKQQLVDQLNAASDIEEIERIELALATGYLEKRV